MNSTRKLLLGTAAATMAVSGGAAQAADILRKAPPIQYVRICDQYGAGYIQIPGTAMCINFRGSLQVDQELEPTRDTVWVSQGKSGAYSTSFLKASQIDNWGYEINAKPRTDLKYETSWGTFRAYVELKGAYDAGGFSTTANGPPGGRDAKAFQLYRGYAQWAGFTVGYSDNYWICKGGYNDDDLQNITTAEKCSGWQVAYTWTASGPAVPPKKGTKPFPDGWAFYVSADSSFALTGSGKTGGNKYMTLAGVTAFGGSAATTALLQDGTLPPPDVEAAIHWEGDPTGKDEQHNDQFGLATINLGGLYHQISTIGGAGLTAGQTLVGPTGLSSGLGPEVHDNGWALTGGFRFYTPMWGPSKKGGLSQPDYVWLYADYCNGAVLICGVGGSDNNYSTGDAYATMGLMRDDLDARWVSTGTSYFADKEKMVTFNASYHHIITDCTDPVYCWRMNLAYNYSHATPGTITQNTDWQSGGIGTATIQRVTFNLIWGTDRRDAPVPNLWETSFEIQYNWLSQALPCNNFGVAGPVCGAPTGLDAAGNPGGVKQNPSNLVFRLTWSQGW
jgi:hypothetical protein